MKNITRWYKKSFTRIRHTFPLDLKFCSCIHLLDYICDDISNQLSANVFLKGLKELSFAKRTFEGSREEKGKT
jgi:hypothetical protein